MSLAGEIGSWVGGGLVGVVLTWGYEVIRSSWRWSRGPMRGRWYQVIPSFKDQPRKVDEVVCRHSGRTVTASIRRRVPADESHRSWRFEGQTQGNLLYGIFFSRDASEISYGTIQMHKQDEFGNVWRGTYCRLRLRATATSWKEELPHIPLEWDRKIPPDVTP